MRIASDIDEKKLPGAFPWIVAEYCEGCSHCVTACAPGALSMCESQLDGVHLPWVLDVSLCNGCGRCQQSCVWGGIQLTSHVGEAVRRMQERTCLKLQYT
jgi:formate hydrogenlyase subunit 6/NADH:ubiquinone oxidoreductase subunit I